ncbi:hypothetical protein A3H65_01305 [Candidatus Giovannonibacteria bacterium RIFCSPLOWO2_02_FULL_45_14]|uniref:Uncharacterized protein n=1 Tax=Candidatus Giovannonibacteria bacterium RIFCSPLOWO2_12_FULL_44_15 TaxID=1798364 RepID=A0A1F5Y150_9BACT|nr:MAG: hypothetical protein A3C75_00895 [Candidatus Giovannonibacteria bacterium RIFCSPHIGHO2_02_FULL_44_31]OGF76430.1 MAG: hypothetical protein A3E62_00875 [Candidatus Giovannonibacteria bacterium RIFCSPHIGHO2_12_FULL_44_29]OGF91109.1 MAG: hypothetical protein A3H65_01305 [Candidatus Giovannonibacteria bacterium RIFCSPLOWO2_02_FULL_45_14]OGF93803.1 MAG: hypothetical protein A3G54_02670 [Candidatus Giovannonibacteria bacterium RIFCSPLOWO2_12_FULL_44_15]
MKIVKDKISMGEVSEMAGKLFGDFTKAVVDIEQGIMGVGGELHADIEVKLMEECGSKRENTWGINIYPKISGEDMIEFDSMVNIKPLLGNRTRGVENNKIKDKIRKVCNLLIKT